MNMLINSAVFWLIELFTKGKLSSDDIDRIKNFIHAQESEAIAKSIKGERARALIKDIAADLSNSAVDWVLETLLRFVRHAA